MRFLGVIIFVVKLLCSLFTKNILFFAANHIRFHYFHIFVGEQAYMCVYVYASGGLCGSTHLIFHTWLRRRRNVYFMLVPQLRVSQRENADRCVWLRVVKSLILKEDYFSFLRIIYQSTEQKVVIILLRVFLLIVKLFSQTTCLRIFTQKLTDF